MLKRHFFIIAAACLLGLMILAAVLKFVLPEEKKGGGPGRPGGGRAQMVAEAVVAPRAFADEIRVVGVARSIRSVNITASTSQLVSRVLFTDGQRVAAGAPLIELRALEEDASIIEARARHTQAQRDLERSKTLAERGVIPRVSVEQAETAYQTSRAVLAAAEARRGDHVIRAPFAGVLGLTSITPGTLISPGSVITTLDDTSAIRVDFPLPERYLGLVSNGTPLVASADAYAGERFNGRIALLDSRVNEQTRAVIARAEFPNPGYRIRPGMMMRVAVQQDQRQALSVPESAVQYEGQGAFVYRIVRGEEGMSAQRVEIQAGAVEGGFVEIISGLTNQDRVVADGLNRIQPGASVMVEGAEAAPKTGAVAQTTKAAR